MNLKVRIDNRTFEVKVGNIKIRPIIVEVDDDIFEVWPEISNTHDTKQSQQGNDGYSSEIQKTQSKALDVLSPLLNSGVSKMEERASLRSDIIRAPIPGVITSVNVDVGSEVSVGEELLKLEAMKMNNSISSNRSGIVKTIHVSIGQIVRFNEELLEIIS